MVGNLKEHVSPAFCKSCPSGIFTVYMVGDDGQIDGWITMQEFYIRFSAAEAGEKIGKLFRALRIPYPPNSRIMA